MKIRRAPRVCQAGCGSSAAHCGACPAGEGVDSAVLSGRPQQHSYIQLHAWVSPPTAPLYLYSAGPTKHTELSLLQS